MTPSLIGAVLKKKWKLGALVGSGGCAEVYEAVDARAKSAGASDGPFVAKIAPLPVGLPPAMSNGRKRKKTEEEKHADMIYYEYTLYKGFLAEHGGVVEIPPGGYGEDQNLRYLVMSRLGPDVEAALKKSKGWSVARKAGYARQMLALLRTLHERCKMVFIDVKPENFMFGMPGSPDEDKIFLIDFGLSARYTGPAGAIKPQGQSAQIQGTPEFLSLKCHGGASAGRCDDLESLGYVIVAMLKEGDRALPWSGSTSVKDGLASKKSTTLEELCQGCPAGMLNFMKAVRGLEYEETPDYDKLDAMLKSMESGGDAAGGARGGRTAPKSKTPAAAAGASTRGSSKAASREEEGDVEVCLDDGKGKGRKGKGGAEASSAKTPPAPGSPKQRATTAVRRSRRLSSPKDGEEFYDALQDHDMDQEEEEEEDLQVTKVVKGAANKGTGRRGTKPTDKLSTAAAAAVKKSTRAKATKAKADGVFLLEVVSGPHEGDTLRMNAGGAEVRVGRNAPRRNGLRLDKDFEVSNKHAILRPGADGIGLEDLGSLNGSFVNEDRLQGAAVLQHGDVLQVGQSIVQITG
ncbi:unnamed protein product [Ectocarpus sp. 13 AM-2016]